MADEYIKGPLRPLIAIGLAVAMAFASIIFTPQDPIIFFLVMVLCFVPQVAVNLALFLRLRSWALVKVTLLAVAADGLIVLCTYALMTIEW